MSDTYDSSDNEWFVGGDDESNYSLDDLDNLERQEETDRLADSRRIQREQQSAWNALVHNDHESKDEIQAALFNYHFLTNRSYKVTQSCLRRYYVKCFQEGCDFELNFNFKNKVCQPPSVVKKHTCSTTQGDALMDLMKPSRMCNLPKLLNWIKSHGRNASVDLLKIELGSQANKMNPWMFYPLLHMLNERTFPNDKKQFRLLEHYAEILNQKQHHAVFETKETDKGPQFHRIAVV